MFTRILFRLLILLGASTPVWGQWTQLPGPSGGEIRSLAVKGVSALAVDATGRLYRGDGAVWRPHGNMRARQVFCVDAVYYADDFGQLTRSTNNGTSWQSTGLDRSIMHLMKSSSAMFAADRNSIFRSTDLGKSWQFVNSLSFLSSIMDMDVDGEYIYTLLVGEGGTRLLRMHEDSTTWIPAFDTLAFPASQMATKLEVDGDNITVFFFNHGVYRSTDRGKTWQSANNGLPSMNDGLFVSDFLTTRKGLYTTTTHGIYHLKGATWQRVFAERDALLVTTNGSDLGDLWAATYSGVYYGGSDGTQWEPANVGLNVYTIRDIKTVGGTTLAATYAGILRSTDQGLSWTQLLNTITAEFAVAGSTVVAIHDYSNNAGVSRSTDGGLTWSKSTTGLEEPFTDVASIIAADGVFYLGVPDGASAGLWRSTDDGISWTRSSDGLPMSEGEQPIGVRAIAAQGANLVAATELGIYWSANRGATWQPSNLQISGSFFSPVVSAAAGRFYLGNLDTLYSSADGGRTWTQEQLLRDGKSTIMDIVPVGDAVIVLAEPLIAVNEHPTNGWVWRDGTWSEITERLPKNVWMLNILPVGDRLLTGTWASGIWHASTAQVLGSTSSAPEQIISSFKLSMYPNPVTDDARIHFTVERPSHVVIDLVNPLGELVQTLFEGHVPEGDHTLLFDAKELPAGIWFYRLSVDGESRTEKVVKQ